MRDLAVPGLQVQGMFSGHMYCSKLALSTVSYLYICRVLSISELSQKPTPDPHHEVRVYILK